MAVWISENISYIVICSDVNKANSISMNLNKNSLIANGILIQDNIIHFTIDWDNSGYHGNINFDEIISQIFKLDKNAIIYSCNNYDNDYTYGNRYCKYLYNNKIIMVNYNEETNMHYEDSFQDETIESYIVKHYLSMLEYVGNVINTDEYGTHSCKCLFCGNECEVFEQDEKDEFDFMVETSDYSCYNCEDYSTSLDLIKLNMKKKNINYEESLNELFEKVMKKYLQTDNIEKDKALIEFRNIIKNNEYQLLCFDELYNEYLNRDKNKKIQEKQKIENEKNSYVKEEYAIQYKKIESKLCIELTEDSNPFV